MAPKMATPSGIMMGMGRRPPTPQEVTTNAQDWVWLGRATLERTSGMLVPVNNNRANGYRITPNPGYNVQEMIDVNAPVANGHIVDSSTYCKDRPRLAHRNL